MNNILKLGTALVATEVGAWCNRTDASERTDKLNKEEICTL